MTQIISFPESSTADFDTMLHDMLERNASRILVVYAYPSRIRQLVPAINRVGVRGRIIFIFPECTSFHILRSALSNMIGSIKIDFNDIPDPSLQEFVNQVTPWTLPQDPWLKANWEQKFSCNYENNSTRPNCYDYKGITESPDWTQINPFSARSMSFKRQHILMCLARSNLTPSLADTLMFLLLDMSWMMTWLKSTKTAWLGALIFPLGQMVIPYLCAVHLARWERSTSKGIRCPVGNAIAVECLRLFLLTTQDVRLVAF